MNEAGVAIIFVRHGETDWNRQGLIQGSVDTELNETGHAQSAAIAQLLSFRKQEFAEYDFFVSPQRRARQTMQYIISAFGMSEAQGDGRLRELGFGIWEGKPFWELKASPIYPADREGRYFWRPEGGESYEDGVARVAQWRAALKRPAIVVSHGAIGRCLMGYTAGLGPRELVGLRTPQGQYCRLANGQIDWFDATTDAA